MSALAQPVGELAWIGPRRATPLATLGIHSVEDLLRHYPRRYEDRRQFDRFPDGPTERPVCVCGTVVRMAVKRLRGWKKLCEAVLEEDGPAGLGATVTCRWFNAHYVARMIATGQRLVVFGRPKRRGRATVLDHPEFEVLEDDADAPVHLRRIAPIHRATEGLTARTLRALIFRTLEALAPLPIPPRLPAELDPTPPATALHDIHFPADWDRLAAARRHLVLDEFFGLQLFLAARRAETLARAGRCHCGPGLLLERFLATLPFRLTAAQHRVLGEIRADLAAPRPMNRLLHGDVGSGKTVVALAAMLLALEAGSPAVLMAPTQILAEQHALNFRRLLAPLGVGVSLRTGNRKGAADPLPLFAAGPAGGASPGAAHGFPPLLVGTHALLFADLAATDPGLVIIDEQHKFGVAQRARLIAQGSAPDVLVMTATPIPRTLTMTLFGDLDVSTLDELPAGRGRTVTAVRPTARLPEAAKFLRRQLEAGRQAFIVYPLIDASDKLAAKAAAEEVAKWRQLLVPLPVDLLHGRLAPEEKEAIMGRFRTGATKALVATQVIEVGIDVPNATTMLVENAERFGLAQLHQLRGRIGRGTHKSYCILLVGGEGRTGGGDSDGPNGGAEEGEALARLHILEETADGFAIAEADLRLRGPGDLLGTAQSGLPPLRIGDPVNDLDLMLRARAAAQAIAGADPAFAAPENRHFRERLADSSRLVLAQVS